MLPFHGKGPLHGREDGIGGNLDERGERIGSSFKHERKSTIDTSRGRPDTRYDLTDIINGRGKAMAEPRSANEVAVRDS